MPPKKDSKKDSKKGSPKKDSPKDKKKPSPKGRKGSPGKGAVLDPNEEPFKHCAIQTEYSNICLFCYKTFHSPVNIQSHLLTMDHFIPEAPIYQQCKVCRLNIHIKDVENHQCCKNKAVFLDQILATNSIYQGPPIVCIFCKGLRFSSKVQLITHLLCMHSVHKEEGRCGLCAFEHQPGPGPLDSDDPESVILMNEDFEKHIEQSHGLGFEMALRKALSEETMLRFPYSCPFCKEILKSNAAFHAHIIGRHAVSQRFQEDLLECLYCDKPKWKPEVLNLHIVSTHMGEIKVRGDRMIKTGSIMNFVEMSTTCTICWKVFTHDFYLQNHIIVNHNNADPYKCGWCLVDFRLIGDSRFTAKEMIRHEYMHSLTIHERAVEFKVTLDPPPPEPPLDEPCPEGDSGGKKGKKNSPGKGGKKESPKKGDKKDGKSGSPDKSKKGKKK